MKDKILECFLCENRLRFSEIERLVGVRSNKLSYHLGKLVDEGVLEVTESKVENPKSKKGKERYYVLSLVAEKMIPYVSSKRAVMSVVLVAIEDEAGRVFLVDRKKRPFKGKLALPGGRMVQGESFEEAVKRIGRKFGVRCEMERVCSVTLEHVRRGDKERVHSFLLILIKVRTEQDLDYIDILEREGEVIGSDYRLIREDLGKEIFVKSLETLD